MSKGKQRYLLNLGLLTLFSINVAYASHQTTTSFFDNNPLLSSWFVSLSGGPGWENNGKQQTFYLTPDIEKTYTTNNDRDTFFNGELFFGLRSMLSNYIGVQYGLALSAATGTDLTGEIWDDADAQFNNYTYIYHVQHSFVGPKVRVLWMSGFHHLSPWISASAGAGFNRSYGFSNTPTIPEALPNNNFTNQYYTTFSYALGLGVQYEFTSWQMGMGYEFSDWGKSQLSSASGQTSNSRLQLQHFYTNGLMFNLTYLN